MGAERQDWGGVGSAGGRLARSWSPGLRKSRAPSGRPGLRVGAGGGGAAQRDPG